MEKDIYDSIIFLKKNGCEVYMYKYKGGKKDKWVAFKQKGMTCVLHGRVVSDCISSLSVKCKNQYRTVGLENVIGFYDTKEECYSVK